MSDLVNSYTFNNLGRMGNELTHKSQHSVHNTRFANHMLADFNSSTISDGHINFASQFPTMNVSGTAHGSGLNGRIIDNSSELSHNVVHDKPYEKLQLNPRPYLTVPYLGRGSVDPTLESQLMQGENSNEKKSISTIMEDSFADLRTQPVTSKMQNRVTNAKFNVEEAALDGWVRGGANTRHMNADGRMKK